MPSLVIINLTNLVLNVAICQIGPLYYQNRLLPGETMHRSLGKKWIKKSVNWNENEIKIILITGHVFYTLEAKPWNNHRNEYDDGEVAAKLAQAIVTLGGLLTPWEIPNYFKTIDNSNIPYWYIKHNDLPWLRKPLIHMSRDRTLILEGGPSEGEIELKFNSDHTINKFKIHDESKRLGQLKIREIPFKDEHKYFYISNEVKITPIDTTSRKPIKIETWIYNWKWHNLNSKKYIFLFFLVNLYCFFYIKCYSLSKWKL